MSTFNIPRRQLMNLNDASDHKRDLVAYHQAGCTVAAFRLGLAVKQLSLSRFATCSFDQYPSQFDDARAAHAVVWLAGPIGELVCTEMQQGLPIGSFSQVTLQRKWQERLRRGEGKDFDAVIRWARSQLESPNRFSLDLALSLIWEQANGLLRDSSGRQRLECLADRLLQVAELSGPEVQALLNEGLDLDRLESH